MRATTLAIGILAAGLAVCGPARAGFNDHPGRHWSAPHGHPWAGKRHRHGPPPWARARHNRHWQTTTIIVVPPPEPEETVSIASEVVCEGDGDIGTMVGVMLDGALTALSESPYASPGARAAAAAVAETRASDADCLE